MRNRSDEEDHCNVILYVDVYSVKHSSNGTRRRIEEIYTLPDHILASMHVVHVLLKKGSSENARKCLRETIDAYVTQDKVALLAPVPGVDLYLCPATCKTVRMLRSFVRQQHAAGLASAPYDGFVGLVLRRREPAATLTSSTPTNYKYGASSSHPSSSSTRSRQPTITSSGGHESAADKKTQLPRPNSDPVSRQLQRPSKAPGPALPAANYNEAPAMNKEAEDDDVPPGFGPAAGDVGRCQYYPVVDDAHVHGRPAAPMFQREQQMRELIHKFGRDGTTNAGVPPAPGARLDINIPTEPWDDDDDDDLTQWQPHHDQYQLDANYFLQLPRASYSTSQYDPSQLHGFLRQVPCHQHPTQQPMLQYWNQHPAAVSVPLLITDQRPTMLFGRASTFPPQLAPPGHLAAQTSSIQGSHGLLRPSSGAGALLWRPPRAAAPVDAWFAANGPQRLP